MEDWIIGMILALFVLIPCWLALSRRNEVRKQVEAWPERARRTGLTFDSNIFNGPKPYHYPGLHGKYRDHYLTMKIFSDSDRLVPPSTSISLNVTNYTPCSLVIQAKSVLDYLRKNIEFPSGNLDFDRRFNSTGSPHEFVKEAVDVIVRSNPRLLAWMMRNHC